MPLLSPVLWIVLIAASLQCLTGLGWWMTGQQLDRAHDKLSHCQLTHQAFVDQTRLAGERAAEKAKRIETERQRIADDTAKSWAAALDHVRADAARRVRLAAAHADSRGLPEVAAHGSSAVGTDSDPIPAAERIAADCAETTLTANALQTYLERIADER